MFADRGSKRYAFSMSMIRAAPVNLIQQRPRFRGRLCVREVQLRHGGAFSEEEPLPAVLVTRVQSPIALAFRPP